jgi:adenylyl-sulfate kinase
MLEIAPQPFAALFAACILSSVMESSESAAGGRAGGSRGCVVWLTGLSGSGKTTAALALAARIEERAAQRCYVLDGDRLRGGLNSDLGFSPADRRENVRRAAEVAALMADAGLIVIVALISPYRADRDAARYRMRPVLFFEVHMDAPLEQCERRDPKGLYRRARGGEIAEFTGVSAPYEPPLAPDLRLDTIASAPDEIGEQLYSFLQNRGIVTPGVSPRVASR